ncbi:MAG: type II toxin-antitoxin system HicB family antitoxin [bacterium]|jgi:predicted RNase H-like HicB family nuclease|uniref:Type II toxin-antitoxin system HicB family antitoxin n=1 Tax=Candidatus Acididesulfobacter diazotrophicus TaxID=2597226 RepID=A0A519BP12_9DELT|nr:MAG: type II toxin-antitoxin system HicB family antitoxin [Candidatus Acididesulfobacter diazotrophicus]
MYNYEMIIHYDKEENLYIAEVPDLPGCIADGKTYEEAARNAHTVIAEWIETAKELNREIPYPTPATNYA